MREAKITVSDLRVALGKVLDAAEAQLGSEIDLAADGYWLVPGEVAYDDTGVDPPTAEVAYLSDDAESVHQMTLEDYDIAVWHDLAHVAGFLRRIAEIARP